MLNPLKIYIEQYVGKQKLGIGITISEDMLLYSKDEKEIIIQSVLKAYRQFKQEKEMELDNLKYAPRETCMPLSIGKFKDPSLSPDFYRGANA